MSKKPLVSRISLKAPCLVKDRKKANKSVENTGTIKFKFTGGDRLSRPETSVVLV